MKKKKREMGWLRNLPYIYLDGKHTHAYIFKKFTKLHIKICAYVNYATIK